MSVDKLTQTLVMIIAFKLVMKVRLA